MQEQIPFPSLFISAMWATSSLRWGDYIRKLSVSLIIITNSLFFQSKSQHCFSVGLDVIHPTFMWKSIR